MHISAGDLLRAEVAAGTPAGKEAASYMDSGNLVPNSVVVEMVVNRLEQPDVQEHGWLLDGYPRSGDQAEAIVQKGIKPDLFVLISVRLLAKPTHLFRACSGPSGSAEQTGLVWCMQPTCVLPIDAWLEYLQADTSSLLAPMLMVMSNLRLQACVCFFALAILGSTVLLCHTDHTAA